LYATGDNSSGQLGDGTANNRSTFTFIADNVDSIACGSLASYILSGGKLLATGSNSSGQLGLDPGVYYSFTEVMSASRLGNSSSTSMFIFGDQCTIQDHPNQLYVRYE